MWSFACMAFELVIGDVLFDLHSGEGFNKDENHMASIMELTIVMPKEISFAVGIEVQGILPVQIIQFERNKNMKMH